MGVDRTGREGTLFPFDELGGKFMIIIVINKHIIRSNAKNNEDKPPVRVTQGKFGKPKYGHEVFIDGFSHIVYDPKNKLPCGAQLWIEVNNFVPVRLEVR